MNGFLRSAIVLVLLVPACTSQPSESSHGAVGSHGTSGSRTNSRTPMKMPIPSVSIPSRLQLHVAPAPGGVTPDVSVTEAVAAARASHGSRTSGPDVGVTGASLVILTDSSFRDRLVWMVILSGVSFPAMNGPPSGPPRLEHHILVAVDATTGRWLESYGYWRLLVQVPGLDEGPRCRRYLTRQCPGFACADRVPSRSWLRCETPPNPCNASRRSRLGPG
jgi:hypothetical protein